MDKQTIEEIRAWLAESQALDALLLDEKLETASREEVYDVTMRTRVWIETETENWIRQLLEYYDDNEARKQADSGG